MVDDWRSQVDKIGGMAGGWTSRSHVGKGGGRLATGLVM